MSTERNDSKAGQGENPMHPKLYYAMYSATAAQQQDVKICKYNLANGDRSVECTAVYACDDYSSPEDVLKRGYLFEDAKCVGIVDKWLRTM